STATSMPRAWIPARCRKSPPKRRKIFRIGSFKSGAFGRRFFYLRFKRRGPSKLLQRGETIAGHDWSLPNEWIGIAGQLPDRRGLDWSDHCDSEIRRILRTGSGLV